MQRVWSEMSAKVLKDSHPKYCTSREMEKQPEEIPIPQVKLKNGEHLKSQTSLPVENLKLKSKKKEATTESKQVVFPIQTVEMDQSLEYKMALQSAHRKDKYQVMMSNAF